MRTPLIAPYVGSDRVLLAELGLHGQIHEVPESLFFRRDHLGSSLRTFPDLRQRVVWFDPSKSAKLTFPEWNEVLGYAGAAFRSPLTTSERLRCCRAVLGWSLLRWRPLLADFKHTVLDLVNRRPHSY